MLKYFDINNNNKIDWWEYIIPFIILLSIEIVAGVISNIITN